MLRMTIIFIIAIVLVTIAIGEEPNSSTSFPDNYLPEDFIFEVTKENESALPQDSLIAPKKSKSPVTFNVNDLPRAGDAFKQKQPKTVSVENTWLEQAEEARQNAQKEMENQSTLPQQTQPTFFSPSLISEETLSFEDVTPSDFGLIDETTTGYSSNIWKGLFEEDAQKLITTLTDKFSSIETSPFAQKILKHLLLTRATAPENATKTSWLAFRAQQLLKIGQSEDAFELLKRTNQEQRAQDHNLAQAWADANLLSFNARSACPSIENFLKTTDNLFWKKKLLLCQLLNQQHKKAELSLKLISEEEKNAAPEFFALFETALFPDQQKPSKTSTKQHFPAELIDQNIILAYIAQHQSTETSINQQLPYQTAALKHILGTPSIPVKTRLKSAEIMAFLDPKPKNISTLTALYTSIPFTKLQIKDPITTAKSLGDSQKERSILYQAAQFAPQDSLKLTALEAFQKSLANNKFSHLIQKLNITETPEPNLNFVWASPYITKALIPDQLQAAQGWSKLLINNNSISPELQAFSDQLKMAIALFSNDEISKVENIKNTQYIQRVITGLDALNTRISSSVFSELSEKNQIAMPVTNSIWLKSISNALQNNKKGEALLMILQPLFAYQMYDLDPLTVSNIATGFSYLDMKSTAKEFMLNVIWMLESSLDQEI